MKLIDNVNEVLGDDLKREISPGVKVRLAASTFSIFAFEALREELERVGELEFIFTAPSFVTTKATDKLRKKRREFFIPGARPCDRARGSGLLICGRFHAGALKVPKDIHEQPAALR